MRTIFAAIAVSAALAGGGCDELKPTDPGGNQPPAATMSFKQGAQYEYQSYRTDPQTQQRTDTTARRRTWTLVSNSATVQGRTNVAVYIDSVFSTGGGFISVSDTAYFHQQTGTNDLYRFASLAPELDVSGVSFLDIGRTWMHESRLNATSANWQVGEVADTIPNTFGIPLVGGFRVAVTDSAVASSVENPPAPYAGPAVQATKTTHRLTFKVSVLTQVGNLVVPVTITTTSLTRTTWTVPSLGAIVMEQREGKVIDVNYQGQGFQIPVPGYVSFMTKVIATGG